MAAIASVSPVRIGGTLVKIGDVPSAFEELFCAVVMMGRRQAVSRPRIDSGEKCIMIEWNLIRLTLLLLSKIERCLEFRE